MLCQRVGRAGNPGIRLLSEEIYRLCRKLDTFWLNELHTYVMEEVHTYVMKDQCWWNTTLPADKSCDQWKEFEDEVSGQALIKHWERASTFLCLHHWHPSHFPTHLDHWFNRVQLCLNGFSSYGFEVESCTAETRHYLFFEFQFSKLV